MNETERKVLSEGDRVLITGRDAVDRGVSGTVLGWRDTNIGRMVEVERDDYTGRGLYFPEDLRRTSR